MSDKNLASTYNPKDYEERIYNKWLAAKYFKADPQSSKPKYTILIPPPNVTDRLHMGHGLNNTIQDILIRWKRMSGFESCWLPGTDHAGIATQMMVEKDLAKNNSSREKIGRDQFLKITEEWRQKYGGIIIDQLKKLGASADWDRLAYTMDPQLSHAVREVFVSLYKEQKIYRGERLVNWDPQLLTALSDDEVENEEKSGSLWHIAYKLSESEKDEIVVATTRPETMFGDVAIAVHPEDDRYKHFIGKKAIIPLTKKSIPIIADEYVKMDFGTGALKITPAHDFNDFEVGQRHKLGLVNILDQNACLCGDIPSEYVGLERFLARKKIIQELKQNGQLIKEQPHKLSVPLSSRSKAVIEPRLSKQWYLKMGELAQPAIDAAKKDEVHFHPDSWKKTYLYWLENIRDWCISRQLWWGHRIPIWHCTQCQYLNCSVEDPKKCEKCQSSDLKQDDDVLDTWFSSWLWPLSPFGWPEKTEDLKAFFPSAVLVTGPDIIFLWVARMIMIGYWAKNQLAFKDVYFNSIICDKDGKKFSKTLGNGIDPLEMIALYGADAVRFTCIHLAPIGGRVRMSKDDFATGARFINKIWNAARFVLAQIKPDEKISDFDTQNLTVPNRWLLERFNATTQEIDKQLNKYQFNEAISSLYRFLWNDYCDWGIECAKQQLNQQPNREQTISVLIYCLEGALRLASPFMPFVSEKIWEHVPAHPRWNRTSSLMVCDYPLIAKSENVLEERIWDKVQEVMASIRSIRAQTKVNPKEEVHVYFKTQDQQVAQIVSEWSKTLAKAKTDIVDSTHALPKNTVVEVGAGYEVYCVVASLNIIEESKRLKAESERIQKVLLGIDAKIKQFNDKVPENVRNATLEQQQNMKLQLLSIQKTLQQMA